MTTSNNMSLPEVLAFGAARSLAVNVMNYPIETVKTNQQVQKAPTNAYSMAMKMFRSDGWHSFYQGFGPHLAKGVVKQTVWWPVITYMPPVLKKYQLSSFQESVATGCSVAALDALVNSPLEKWRVLASTGQSNSLSVRSIMFEGWSGFFPYFRRQSITWSLFFIGHHHFKKEYTGKDETGIVLTPLQTLNISFKISLIGSLIFSPFDMKNTIGQINKKGAFNNIRTLSTQNLRLLYRGFPLNFLSMLTQTTATIYLMNYIESKRKK